MNKLGDQIKSRRLRRACNGDNRRVEFSIVKTTTPVKPPDSVKPVKAVKPPPPVKAVKPVKVVKPVK
ncbi:hypothetical protein KKF84_20560 [Myxococcota bacterium]|nr:hypothetical protein [Myxococcota bacterium]MBU1537718.1 hypothetical protein [Myxococcota bacterium]